MAEFSNADVQPDLISPARSDPTAFNLLYRRYYDTVFGYCVHRLFDRHTAEDLTSEVFLNVVENFHRFEGDERQFRNWLYKIATNAVNHHLRKTSRRSAILTWVLRRREVETDAEITPVDDSQHRLLILKKAMLSLKPRYQAVITMRFFENLKPTEIAEVLGTSAAIVRSQLSRALGKMRKQVTSARRYGREV